MRISFILVLAAFMAGACLAVLYGPGLQGDFFFDDEPSILRAEGVRLDTFSRDALREAASSGRSGPSGRPVAQLSFALNHYFSGFDPFAFKATNLAIHAACGLLVFLLALRLLAVARIEPTRHSSAIFSGLLATLWLLHPLQLTSILHVVQRMTSLSALFLLAALLLHIIARERGGGAGAMGMTLAWGVLWPLSFFSKETGVLFPLFALAWELIIRRSAHGGLDRFARVLALLAGLTVAAGALYSLLPQGKWLWVGYDYRAFTLAERLLTEGRVLWFYLSLMLAPRLEALGLHHDDIAVSTGLIAPWTTLPAWVGLAGLIWLAWHFRKKMPLLTFGIAWFFVGHLLESTVLPLEIAHEHRNYLPLFGIMLAVVAILYHTWTNTGSRKTAGLALSIATMLYFPFVTGLRAHQFGNELRRTQIEAQHHRSSARAQYDAGRALGAQAEATRTDLPAYSFARAHFERAGELDSAFKLGWLGLIHLNCRAGLETEQAWVNELARRLRDTPLGPGDVTILHAVKEMSVSGELCLNRRDVEALFLAALLNPGILAHFRVDAHSWLADYLVLSERDFEAARTELDRALAIAPYNPGNRLKQVQLAILQGRFAEAVGMLKGVQALQLNRSEQEMLAGLRRCLDSSQAGTTCMIR